MQRRKFIKLIGAAAGTWPLRADAQSGVKIPRIGVLWHAGSAAEESIFLAAFRQGLADFGYVEGRNIVAEHRFPAELPDRFRSMAAELAELKMDVLVAAGTPPALALQQATKTIPIVFVAANDPIGVGLVNSLARPTGNITGLINPDLIGKRLEILKEVFPNLTHAAVLVNITDPSYARRYIESAQTDVRNIGLGFEPVEVNGPNDLKRAFSSIAEDAGTGVAAAGDVMFYNNRKLMCELALSRHLPAIFSSEEFVRVGGLSSYGASIPAIFRRSAFYVDRILKGAKPSDLPVEQPTLFRLFINLTTAKALDLTLPPLLLTRADEVIE
jgi:putative tryptophan/tyrosine transport system substrate-binding protein